MKNYKNIYINVPHEDMIERCLNARGEECDSLTEAKRRAAAYGGYAIRVYFAADSGDVLGYKIFY